RVLALGVAADAVRRGVGVAAQPDGLALGPGAHLADLAVGGALDALGQALPLALVLGGLLGPLAADALEDRLAHGGGVVGPAQPDVDDLDAVLAQGGLAQGGGPAVEQAVGQPVALAVDPGRVGVEQVA